MTSISQQPSLAPQASQTAPQTATQVHSPSASISGTTSPLAAVPAPPARSYANATKKPLSPSNASDTIIPPLAVGGPAPAQHGQLDSKSPANGNQIPPAVPTVNTPTIVNGNNTIPSTVQGDHSRKPSVTISAAGATGYIPNGGPVAGPQSRPNSIQFGTINAGGSPAQGNATLQNQSPSMLGVAQLNPRVSSPQTSPSPIPQPAASGGRPPSSLQGQGNGPIFGSLGGESGDVGSR
jgi:translation initiation factor 4G